jgi:hypothetical protein
VKGGHDSSREATTCGHRGMGLLPITVLRRLSANAFSSSGKFQAVDPSEADDHATTSSGWSNMIEAIACQHQQGLVPVQGFKAARVFVTLLSTNASSGWMLRQPLKRF